MCRVVPIWLLIPHEFMRITPPDQCRGRERTNKKKSTSQFGCRKHTHTPNDENKCSCFFGLMHKLGKYTWNSVPTYTVCYVHRQRAYTHTERRITNSICSSVWVAWQMPLVIMCEKPSRVLSRLCSLSVSLDISFMAQVRICPWVQFVAASL